MLLRLRQRIEANCAQHGLLYPWWVPATCLAGQLVCVGVALALRHAWWPPDPLLLTIPLVAATPLAILTRRRWPPWWLDGIGTVIAALWLMWNPVDDTSVDLAPTLLALLTAEATARDGVRPGTCVGLVGVGALMATAAGPGVHAVAIYLLELVLGFVVGAMLRWQMRALRAERDARERAWAQATLSERQRIAREIHDLVAHSLSVTLLHLTGARRALRDVAEEVGGGTGAAGLGEVDEALLEAERIGRRAMADIRRTVSTLGSDLQPASPYALPDAGGIEALVGEAERAGLAVRYRETGDPGSVPDAIGLGLYRIAQESLANIAKHARSGRTIVRLAVRDGEARLTVRNQCAGPPRADGVGSGLPGMRARAAQLGADLRVGPDAGYWIVDVRAPIPGGPEEARCPLRAISSNASGSAR
ncbi:MAG: histidine kinase [Nocardioides sp.]|uniref:sensor histidine kinase n=1 Tax=Nocardioides sp. TaxID=35761 RepID=UPI0039E637C2